MTLFLLVRIQILLMKIVNISGWINVLKFFFSSTKLLSCVLDLLIKSCYSTETTQDFPLYLLYAFNTSLKVHILIWISPIFCKCFFQWEIVKFLQMFENWYYLFRVTFYYIVGHAHFCALIFHSNLLTVNSKLFQLISIKYSH